MEPIFWGLGYRTVQEALNLSNLVQLQDPQPLVYLVRRETPTKLALDNFAWPLG